MKLKLEFNLILGEKLPGIPAPVKKEGAALPPPPPADAGEPHFSAVICRRRAF